MPQRVAVIVNASSGVGAGEDMRDELERHLAEAGIDAKITVARPEDDLDSLAAEAAADTDIVVAAGGDGTISAVAVAVHAAGKTLGVLPLGTLNNFSKDLGIPQDIAGAVEVLKNGVTRTIDLAEANGRVFINNSSIGLYPRIVRKREKQQRLGYGKWRAALWATLRIFMRGRFVKVRITLDDKTFFRKTPFVFVGNNRYEMDLYNIGRRSTLDDGKLSIYFLHRSGRWGVILLLWHTLTGRVRQWRDFEEVLTETVTIQTRRRRISVAFDGEVTTLETPLEYKIIPNALRVIVPAEEAADA
jgi:YegS/Rv2252/BmrU family lipid kinase